MRVDLPSVMVMTFLLSSAMMALAGSIPIWDQNGQLVIVNQDALTSAPEITISRDGAPVATGDQLVMSFDVDPSSTVDTRQVLVIDTNGLLRLRHLDGAEMAGQEDKSGTSVKLPPGLIVNRGDRKSVV